MEMKTMWLALNVIFHPLKAFDYMKGQNKHDYYMPTVLLLFMILLVRISYIFIVHYPLAALRPKDANIGLEILRMLLPVVTWAISCYLVTSILDGETHMREIFMASAYSMLPYIVCTIPLALLSRLLDNSQKALFHNLQTVIWIWIFLLFFVSLMTMNEYSFRKTVGIFVLNIIAMLLVWAVCLLIFTLISQFLMFIKEYAAELRLLYQD